MRQAFPTRGDLRRMVGYGLSLNLDEIAGDSLSDIVYNLLVWAEAPSELDDFGQSGLR